MDSPRATIVVPVYNLESYVAETLESLKNQTFTDFEVIVVDDGSTDSSQQVVEPFLKDPRFTYIRQDNAGPGAARNNALRRARGEWFGQLDGDDIWLPDFLEKMLALLDSDPKANLAYCNVTTFRIDGNESVVYADGQMPEGDITSDLYMHCIIFLSSALVKTADLRAIQGYDETLKLGEDYDLWLRLIRRGAWVKACHEPLLRYRIRPQSRVSAKLANLEYQVYILQRALDREDRPSYVRVLRRSMSIVKSQGALERARLAARENGSNLEKHLWLSWRLNRRNTKPLIFALLCLSSRISGIPVGRRLVLARLSRSLTGHEIAESISQQ